MSHFKRSPTTIFRIDGALDGPPPGTYWRISKHKFKEFDKDNRIWWGEEGNNVPAIKRFLSEVKQGRVPQTLLTYDEVGHSQEAKKELLARVTFSSSDVVFDTPKPTRLMRRLLQVATNPKEPSIVLDFFAGTGTIQDAIFQQNLEDGGKRQCIIVQFPELLAAAKPDDSLQTITDIAKERIRRAGQKIKADNADKPGLESLDIGFRVLKIDTSNMKDVYYTPVQTQQAQLFDQIDNIKEDRTAEDLLFQVMLDWGVDLTLPIHEETIEGRPVYFVAENSLAACFETDIDNAFVKALAAKEPVRAVFRDAGFDSDSAKINAKQIFARLSPHTELKTI